jgi:peroxin-1
LDPESKTNVLLLTTNTEVSIAPNLRRDGRETAAKAVNDQKEGKERPKMVLRVVPPYSFPAVSSSELSGLICFVSPSTLAGLLRNEHASETHFVTIRRLEPPIDPTSLSPQPTEQAANSSGQEDSSRKLNSNSGIIAKILAINEIPPCHIVFRDSIEAVDDWDLVRYLLSKLPFFHLFNPAQSGKCRRRLNTRAARYKAKGDTDSRVFFISLSRLFCITVTSQERFHRHRC